ncbi:MAG: hypothetical protein WAN11_24940, partial [Syntrophobacteraceae bacterium]
ADQLSISFPFVNLHGLPIRSARIRSIIASSANDLTLVGANVNFKLILFSHTHRTRHLPATEMMLPPKILQIMTPKNLRTGSFSASAVRTPLYPS